MDEAGFRIERHLKIRQDLREMKSVMGFKTFTEAVEWFAGELNHTEYMKVAKLLDETIRTQNIG